MLIDELHGQHPEVIQLFKSHNLEYLLYKEWNCEKSYPFSYHFENYSLSDFHRKFPIIRKNVSKYCFVFLYENGDSSFRQCFLQKNGEAVSWAEHGFTKTNKISGFYWNNRRII